MGNDKVLLSAWGKYREYLEVDSENPEKWIFHTVQDCEPIVERAKMLSELEPGKDFRHVMCVPQFLLDRAHREGWYHDKQKWKDVINDPQYKAFRTWPGRV